VSDESEYPPKRHRRYRIAGTGDASASPTPMTAGHVDDLAAAYALGALDPDEAAFVDAHTRTCVACDGAVAEAQRTAGMLPFLVPIQSPPADAKVALFARVAHAHKAAAAASLPSQALSALRTPTLPNSSDVEWLAPRPVATAVVEPAPSSSRSRAGILLSALSLPLLVALVATGFWGMQLQNQLTAQDSQLAQLQSELTNFGSGTTSYPLSPGEAAPQAEGQIVLGKDQRAGMVQIDLNTDQGARAFEMWVNQGGTLMPVAGVTVDSNGQGQASFQLDEPFGEYDSFHIKAKPVGSSGDSLDDALLRDAEGSLGSTGSGLDLVP
jgi:hypothetical protein